MDIRDIRENKAALEKEIFMAIKQFEAVNGVMVMSIVYGKIEQIPGSGWYDHRLKVDVDFEKVPE